MITENPIYRPVAPRDVGMLRGRADERAEAIATRCGSSRLRYNTWVVCCPAHDDTSPSLHITPMGDTVLIHCFAGCAPEAILAAVGLSLRDLYADDLPPMSPPKKRQTRYRIPEPPGTPTQQNFALQFALELLVDDVKLLEVEACQTLFRKAADDPLTRLWVEQQLQRHHLDPATVWHLVKAPASTVTARVRTFRVTSGQGAFACPAR
jgi:hypothetical protein